jgi:peptidoglycan-N-acetylglucosamine deacetylase
MDRYEQPRTAALSSALALMLAASACDTAHRSEADDARDAPRDTAAAALPAMAVTIDDLPWIGPLRPEESRADVLRRLAEIFVARGVPAVGFVNCDRTAAGSPPLRAWLDAGLELGNHTAAHLDLNDAPLQQWLSDARSCHEFVRAVTGSSRVWFRYPYLHQGPDSERQEAALALLRELDSPIAHVTIDNSDWILAVPYGRAVAAGDSARAAEIGEAFIRHILDATLHYQEIARQRFGRDVRHVLLLHANLLVADYVGPLLDRLRDELGFGFITLTEAQRDPVYRLPDDYAGPEGLSWLYRFEPAQPELQEWDLGVAQRLRSLF